MDRNLIEVLAINCQIDGSAEEVETTLVVSLAAALDVIRRRSFDLLVTATSVDGTPIWPLVRKLRMVRPKLQWWLVAHGIDPADERVARTLGVARLMANAPSAELISTSLAGRRPGIAEQRIRPRPNEPLQAAMP